MAWPACTHSLSLCVYYDLYAQNCHIVMKFSCRIELKLVRYLPHVSYSIPKVTLIEIRNGKWVSKVEVVLLDSIGLAVGTLNW